MVGGALCLLPQRRDCPSWVTPLGLDTHATPMITRCPSCDYSLTGLPTEHRCPECGLQCERDAVVFGQPRTVWKLLALANVAMLVLSIVALLWRGATSGGIWLIALFATMSAGWIWNVLAKRSVVLVSPRTIRILKRGKEQQVYAIADVGQIKWSFVTGDIVIERSDGTQLTTIKQRFLGSNLTARRVVKTVREYVDAR